ncbi:splicing factor 3B subunit 2-like [Triticum aestivum]|uniref:splicing factor 3B subunit 2-like n=1 Tax=Triticum aestivum TaxID=4565 RepID=UPI001D006860|nr:splicing factor 3B subunit 2-like [Triticum aestivum]XP_044445047.1 splicing factor 3B subunit 2-like [Triticum aestivum]
MPTAVAVVAAASPTPRDSGRGRPRRLRRRRDRKSRAAGANAGAGEESARPGPDPAPQVEVEYVPEKPDLGADDPLLLGAFAAVFEKFGLTGPAAAAQAEDSGPSSPPAEAKENAAAADAEQEAPKKEEEEAVALSKKQRKQLRRVKISELRQMCSRPDVVEVWDGNAPDPKLLVCLKSRRNTVPVPRHWCQKRKYLQGKRGFQKQPFQLPDFIAATGIEKIRQAYVQKMNNKTLKQKQHNRMQPKRGYMDMDYEVLHDAFFKYQTKPTLTSYGDLYYEGKEFEPKLKVMKPGMLSQELKKALGMPDGAPPPWLTRMQFFGPPPSYPYLKIPGLGDEPDEEEPLNRTKHWGDLDEEEDEEEEKEEELIIHEEIEEGVRSIDTVSSTLAGAEAPDVIELRKLRKESDNQAERPLYQVLEQKEVRIAHRALFASSHAYVSLAKPTEYVLLGAQGTPSLSGGNFGDGPGEMGKPSIDEGEPIDHSKHWEELDEEEEEEEELEDGKIEKGILEEEEVLEDGGIEEDILKEEEEEEDLKDGEVEERTLEELEEELEDGEIVQSIRQEEEEELEDGEIVQGIRQEEEEELEDGEIVEGIRQEVEEELEDGEIVEGIRQEEEEEGELEEGGIVEGIRKEEKEEDELEEGEIVEGIRSGHTISSSTPAGVETPDVIDLRKSWRKECERRAERPLLYQVLEQKEERVASASALYLSSHRYVVVGAQDKPSTSSSSSSSSGPKSKRKLERVDVTIHPDQLDAVEDALAAKYRELWGEESKGNGKGKMGRKLVGGEGSSWVSPPSWKTATKRKKVDFKF